MSKIVTRLMAAFFFLLITACAVTGNPVQTALADEGQHATVKPDSGEGIKSPPADDDGESWHTVAFKITWPADEETAWSTGVMLGHKMIKPVLESYKDSITLWRFHRRATRNITGHQFSFIFYSSSDVASQIYEIIRSNQELAMLQDVGVIEKVKYIDSTRKSRPEIEDTSDKNWSVPVQKTWPWFIMGASEMWLRLVDEFVAEAPDQSDDGDYQATLAFYAGVSDRMDKFWRFEGNHSLFHHLSALYGYNELIVVERKLMRF